MSLRIAIAVDPYIPVPPVQYGGIERVVDVVIRGLRERGHHVTLFAHPESRCPVDELVPYGVPPHVGSGPRARELLQLGGSLWSRRRKVDVVFNWGRLAAMLPILGDRSLAKVQRYCRGAVPWSSVRLAVKLGGDSIQFAGASSSVYDQLFEYGSAGGVWHTLYDGIEMDRYALVTEVAAGAPLAFLGRIERIKGVHTAISIARKAGRRLLIAGNRVDDEGGRRYFDDEVAPFVDGTRIRYVGPVNDAQKDELLGGCAALLFPIQWREAFGIVMAESMACGTPVIAFPCGSVPEIIRPGVNGFICRSEREACEAILRLGEIDRRRVRDDCNMRFGASALVNAFEQVLYLAVERVSRIGDPHRSAVQTT